MSKKNVFVLGLNDFNREKLERVRHAADYRFHGVLDPDTILEADYFPIDDMLRQAEREIRATGEPVDAIIGYVDFPVSTMLPILAGRFGVRSAPLQSLLQCEHKYWSRLSQRQVVPDHVPPFQAFDPFDPEVLDQIELDYPYWVKPIKSAGSYLGFRIESREDLRAAVHKIREHIGVFSEPFNVILGYTELPPEVKEVTGNYCIAEGIIGGRQCTLEGYVSGGEVGFHGMVDSIRARGSSTFLRYQYPSRLPERVIDRAKEIARKVLTHIGYDDAAFNAEFYWDKDADQVWLLEINTRIAQHHSDLFEKVDGVSNHEIAVEVALGHRPEFPHREGKFAYAGCCWLRRYRDGVVKRVPTDAEIAELEAEIPGLDVELHVKEGQRLSELTHQESYSFVLAIVYVGAEDPERIRETLQTVRQRLHFAFRP